MHDFLTMRMASDLEAHLVELETSLFTAEVRRSAADLERLLDEEFVEIASTGARFGKAEALTRLPAEEPPEIAASGFTCRRLGPGVVQVLYEATLRRAGEDAVRRSRRSSIWRATHPGSEGSDWRMVFHQGTNLPAE